MFIRIIGGSFRGRRIGCPKGHKTRPTSSKLREAVFSICQSQVVGCRFLDLFSGSGAIGIEALSRGASHVTFIDRDVSAIECIRTNLDSLSISPSEQTTLLQGDALRLLSRVQKGMAPYDLVYVDPPYRSAVIDPVLCQLVEKEILLPTSRVFVEVSGKSRLEEQAVPGLACIRVRPFGSTKLIEYCLLE